MKRSTVVAGALLVLAACGDTITESRMAVRPSKPDDCGLDLVEVRPEDMADGQRFGKGGEFEWVGTVSVGGLGDMDPASAEVRNKIRARACNMGGDLVSLMTSSSANPVIGPNARQVTYRVWAKRAKDGRGNEAF